MKLDKAHLVLVFIVGTFATINFLNLSKYGISWDEPDQHSSAIIAGIFFGICLAIRINALLILPIFSFTTTLNSGRYRFKIID